MIFKKTLIAATALMMVTADIASAQPGWVPPGNDPNGYYSDNDHNGYYDRNGTYRRIQDRGYRGYRDRDDRYGPPPPPPPPAAYYQQGRYEADCRSGNQIAGTIFGALAGGLIGGAASRGNGGAVAGGAILGGLLGNVISRDIDCEDQPVAFQVYAAGLNGPIGQRSQWRNRDNYGYFTPTREFYRGTVVCREFTETSYRRGRASVTRTGTACRETGGNWRFD
jgi:surface antigen